jgi:hypothetical protein
MCSARRPVAVTMPTTVVALPASTAATALPLASAAAQPRRPHTPLPADLHRALAAEPPAPIVHRRLDDRLDDHLDQRRHDHGFE